MSQVYQHLDLHIENDVAWVGLDMKDKTVNVFNGESMAELSKCTRHLHGQNQLKGVVIYSKKKDQFIAGADISEIANIQDPASGADKARIGQDLMQSIENLQVPVVAAINGPCIGGGLELALACTYRIVSDSPNLKLQLPEVQLGILPGFGGTQRLPKWVGLVQALDMILTGKSVFPKKALKIGLIDDIVPRVLLFKTALKWIHKGRRTPHPYKLSKLHTFLQKLPPVQKIIFSKAQKNILKKTNGHYPAPLKALDLIQKTFSKDEPLAYDMEAEKLGRLAASPTCKSLVALFQATEKIKKTSFDHPAQPIHNTAVMGVGVMGAGIAQLFAQKKRNVRLKDISYQALEKGLSHIFRNLEKTRKKRRLPRSTTERVMHRLSFTTDNKGFHKTQLLIEAIVEDIGIKQKVLGELAQLFSNDTIIATNTSALSVSEIAKAIPHPERVVGLHFFNPVDKMPLIEIIQGDQTSPQTIASVYALALSLGKTPILVADRPGFLVNRILGIYLAEATCMAEEGISIQSIDNAMKNFGMPMGPFELMDEVGIDIAHHVGKFLGTSFDYFPTPTQMLSKLMDAKRLGKKNGLGFYKHQKTKQLDTRFINSLDLPNPTDVENELRARQIVDRLVLLMGNEAFRCLEENVVQTEQDVDIGMVLGTGFAPHHGGLIRYIRSRNLEQVKAQLEAFSHTLGRHFQPCQKLIDLSYRS